MSVRVAGPRDAAAIQAIYAREVESGVASFETEPPTVAEMAGRMNTVLPRFPWLVWEEAGRVAGYAYASPHRDRAAYRWSVDVTVYLAPEAQGRGVGKALYARLFAILKRQGFHAAYAGITLPNPASVRLHEACGFTLIGVYPQVGFKHGAWRDTCWMRRPLKAHTGQPAEPIPFAELGDESAA